MCYSTFICHELDDQRKRPWLRRARPLVQRQVSFSKIDDTRLNQFKKRLYRQRVSQFQVSRISPNDAHKASSESINIPSSFSDKNYNNMQVFLQLDKAMLFVFRWNQITLQSVSMLSLHFSMHFLNNERHLFNRWAQKSSTPIVASRDDTRVVATKMADSKERTVRFRFRSFCDHLVEERQLKACCESYSIYILSDSCYGEREFNFMGSWRHSQGTG